MFDPKLHPILVICTCGSRELVSGATLSLSCLMDMLAANKMNVFGLRRAGAVDTLFAVADQPSVSMGVNLTQVSWGVYRGI